MRVIRKQAYQGHAVPSTASHPVGPFPAELLRESVIVYDDNDPDDMYPAGATAQNNYAPPKLYKCQYCGDIVTEYEVDSHVCPDDNEEYEDGE